MAKLTVPLHLEAVQASWEQAYTVCQKQADGARCPPSAGAMLPVYCPMVRFMAWLWPMTDGIAMRPWMASCG